MQEPVGAHPRLLFYNPSKPVQQAGLDRPGCLPLELRWIITQMIATHDLSVERHVPVGTEILAISAISAFSGLAALALLERQWPYARAGASNDAKRVGLLQVQGLEGHETFDVFAGLPNSLGDRGQLDIHQPQARAIGRIPVTTLTCAKRAAARPVRADDTRSGWRIARESNALATHTMPGWALYDTKWDRTKSLAPRFKSQAQMFVLIGLDRSWPTRQFAQVVRARRLVHVVGRVTGGSPRRITGGGVFFLRLPASGPHLDVPMIARSSPRIPPDAGHGPDIVSGRDAELAPGRSAVANAPAQAASFSPQEVCNG